MEKPATAHRAVRFALFEVDLDSGELRKNGVKLKIQEQPLQTLCLLLDRPGEIVTREELQQKLWPDGTFVDFEHGVNTAVKKLREVLGDDANNPRFVETVPRRGYRFIVPADGKSTISACSPASDRPWIVRRKIPIFAAVLVVVFAAAFAWRMRSSDRAGPRIIRSKQVTFRGQVYPGSWETYPSIQTDGRRIYYSDTSGRLRYVAVGGGEEELLSASPFPVVLLHISPDGSTLLAREAMGQGGASESALWLVPANGGSSRRFGDIEAQDAAWSPDGKAIAFAEGQTLFLTDDRGSSPRKLTATSGRAFWLRWSPDGKRLRFTVFDSKVGTRTLWEMRVDGSPHQLLANWKGGGDLCNGIWSPDGRSYLFLNIRDGESQLWSLPERRFLGERAEPTPVVPSAVGVHIVAVAASPLGKKLFVIGSMPLPEVSAVDLVTKRSTQLIPGIGVACCATYSHSGKWVAFMQLHDPDVELWRARSDGTALLQLTAPPLSPTLITAFAPDDSRIAFMGRFPGQPYKVYWVSAEGGGLHELPADIANQADPNWSPDGQSIIFGEPPHFLAESGKPKAIYVSNLQTNHTSKITGSDGWFSPRISPDGGSLAALSIDFWRLGLLDTAHGSWRNLVETGASNPFWSSDGQWIYYHSNIGGLWRLWRVRAKDGHKELVLTFPDLFPNADCYANGFTPNQSLNVGCTRKSADIYALDWE